MVCVVCNHDDLWMRNILNFIDKESIEWKYDAIEKALWKYDEIHTYEEKTA